MTSTSGPWHHIPDPSQLGKCQGYCGQFDKLNSEGWCKPCLIERKRRLKYSYKRKEVNPSGIPS